VDSPAQLVEDRDRVAELFENLAVQWALLASTVPAKRGVYTSAVLAVHRPRGSFDLDELVPAVGNRHLAEIGTLRLSGRLAGADISAEVELLGEERQGGLPYYSMALPSRVWYRERRSSCRRHGLDAAQAALTLPTDSDTLVHATVRDLSADGVAFEVGVGADPNARCAGIYARGRVIEDAVLTLDGRWDISCNLEVRYVSVIPAAGSTPARIRVGARLASGTSAVDSRLEAWLQALRRRGGEKGRWS
jgi:hypothetical protein